MRLPWLTEEDGVDGELRDIEVRWFGGSVLQQHVHAQSLPSPAFYTQGSIAEISPFDHKPSLSPLTALHVLHIFTQGFHNEA